MRTVRIGGFSGGADSQALAIWMLNHFPKEEVMLMNTEAGRNECGATVEFTKWFSENIHPVIVVTPLIRDLAGVGTRDGGTGDRRREFNEEDEMTFADLAYIKGRFPARKSQFCTKLLKLAPQRRWIKENLIDPEPDITIIRYTGVRRDESEARKNVAETEWDEWFDCELHRPLATWTKQQVFDYIKQHGQEPNPLYKMGFNRVGCAPCVNSGKEDIRNWNARFPEMIQKVRDWEKEVGRTFFPPMVPGMVINWIDDVVAWSKTERGGKIPLANWVDDEVVGTCSSKYGLCE